MPLRLGVTDDPAFCAGDGLLSDAAFDGRVVWIHERVFEEPNWEARASWLLEHEILHAKMAVALVANRSWLGKRRLGILEKAARDALRLAHMTPSLRELSDLLIVYQESELDEAEEALVRYIQLLDAGEKMPMTPVLMQAQRILNGPWGWAPFSIFRTVLWLPVCGWTARLR
ncbi:hypothetical protein FGG78_17505 [Thioclava sp. BHET1]|nr:hypothetical protein FGG78_17505 [Thioclava sp. BHET1]